MKIRTRIRVWFKLWVMELAHEKSIEGFRPRNIISTTYDLNFSTCDHSHEPLALHLLAQNSAF